MPPPKSRQSKEEDKSHDSEETTNDLMWRRIEVCVDIKMPGDSAKIKSECHAQHRNKDPGQPCTDVDDVNVRRVNDDALPEIGGERCFRVVFVHGVF